MSDKNLQDYAVELATEALRGYEFIDVVEQLENLTDEECEQVHDLIAGEVKVYIPESPRIIRTVEELEALDRDTVVISSENGEVYYVKRLTDIHVKSFLYVPAVVVATGTQVRAAREAMEVENDF